MAEPLSTENFRLEDGEVPFEDLQNFYYEVLERMRAEARKLPGFDTAQDLLVERVARGYIKQRVRERPQHQQQLTLENAVAAARFEKDMTTLWLSYLTEMRKVQVRIPDEDAVKAAMLEAVGETIRGVLDKLPDNIRPALKEQFAAAFETAEF